MKNTNKPQWLIDAERDINEFHETKHGKMSQRQINYSESSRNKTIFNDINKNFEHQSNASLSRDANERLIQFSKIKTKEHQSKAGKVAGNKNVESGHWANIQKIATLKANEKIECEHCKRMIDRKNHSRWHGDNCKLKPLQNILYK